MTHENHLKDLTHKNISFKYHKTISNGKTDMYMPLLTVNGA